MSGDGASAGTDRGSDGGHSANGEGRCDLCDESRVDSVVVANEETGETRAAELCEDHLDKLDRYNRGEGVGWDV